MATSTTNYSFSLPEVGGDTDQWGTQLNANWTLADSTIKTIEDSVVDVTLTGNDYLTISGQSITVGDVDLTTDVTGTLPVGSGGTGLAALGSANQVLAVNSTADGLEFQTISGSGTVTSVTVTGSDGIEIDSGSPITSSGTIALGINATSLSTHLGLGSLATQSTITESQISDLGSYITASSTDTLTNKSGNISQWTNDSGYLTAETNDLTNVSGTLAIANGGTGQTTAATARVALLPTLATNGSKLVAVNSGATDIEYIATSTLSITESQISDLQSYLTAEANDLSAAVTWVNVPDGNITQSSVTQHQSALSITESQISDLGSYQISDAGLTSIAGLTTAADKMIYTTAADTYAVSTLTAAGRALLDDADAAAQRTTLGLGTAATSNTSAFEASGAVSTHAAVTSSVHGISAFGATLVDDADAAAARTTLGLGSLATQSTITESQISDLQGYLTAETNDLGTAVTGTLGIGNGGTGLTALGSAGQVLTVNSGANALEYQTPLVALPITDSAGNNVLSESGSVVTLSADAAIIAGSSSGNLVRITQTGTGNALVVEDSANPDSTPFVVDASGNVGIGTSSPEVKLDVAGDILINNNSYLYGENSVGGNSKLIGRDSNDTLFIGDPVYTNPTIIQSGNNYVGINTNGTERMRIDSSGNVGIGPSSLVSSWKGNLNIVQPSGTKTELYFFRDTQVEGHIGFLGSNTDTNFYIGTGAALGNNGTYQLNNGNSWISVSDERQKTNLIPIVDAINKIKQLRTVTGRFLTDEDGISRSFLIAQDFVNNFPEAVDTNNPEKYGLSYTDVIPLIVAGFKEQQTIIESQQSQIDALTARIEALETT